MCDVHDAHAMTKDPLFIVTLVSIVVIGVIATIDVAQDGQLNPALLPLLGSILVVVPAFLARRNGRNGHD